MRVVNVIDCELDEELHRGEFRCRVTQLTERLGASVIGAAVYEIEAGNKQGPYHCHYGVEEWMYVVSGAPVLRDPDGERTLEPGSLVAFAAGPSGAHTLSGPGRVVLFSAGARGWAEAFVTVYPDSDKIGAAPGVMFRRSDAIDRWSEPVSTAPGTLGGETWIATQFELEPGSDTGPYRVEWSREEWALVLSGAPTLRHPDGDDVLRAGDVVCFPQGPAGARRLSNHGADTVRLVTFFAPAHRPRSTFYPDDGTVAICPSDGDGLLFRLDDHIEDYWDGEPGAGTAR